MNADAKSRRHPLRGWREDPRALRRVTLRIWVQCWLVLVWILLWGNISVANIVSGLVIALVISTALPMPPVPVEGRLHPLSLLRLILRVTGYLVLSSVQVAWLAMKPGPPPLSAVLRAPMAVKSDLVLALAVNIVNLIPGSIVLEIDQARRLLYVHVIDVGSPRTVNQFYRQIAEVQRLLVAAFERSSEWRPAISVDTNLVNNDLVNNDLVNNDLVDNDRDEGSV